MIFIRDEWGTMIDLFNKREKGILGGAAFTGQPVIGGHCHHLGFVLLINTLLFSGKTCMLYYMLIL